MAGRLADGRRAVRCLCHFVSKLRVKHRSGIELNQDDRGVRVQYRPRRRRACPRPRHQAGRRFRRRCVDHQRPIDDHQESGRWVPGHRLRRRDLYLHPSLARRPSERLALQQHLESCVVTGVLPHGSISADGIITTKAGVPQNATFAVAGGTGSFGGAQGTVKVTFGSNFDVLTIVLQ